MMQRMEAGVEQEQLQLEAELNQEVNEEEVHTNVLAEAKNFCLLSTNNRGNFIKHKVGNIPISICV